MYLSVARYEGEVVRPGAHGWEEGRRVRWVMVGRVRNGWPVTRGQWGNPHGYLMHWMGWVDVFQPVEFDRWNGVESAVRRRLALTGLEMECLVLGCPARWVMPFGTPRTREAAVWCLVRRGERQERKRKWDERIGGIHCAVANRNRRDAEDAEEKTND